MLASPVPSSSSHCRQPLPPPSSLPHHSLAEYDRRHLLLRQISPSHADEDLANLAWRPATRRWSKGRGGRRLQVGKRAHVAGRGI